MVDVKQILKNAITKREEVITCFLKELFDKKVANGKFIGFNQEIDMPIWQKIAEDNNIYIEIAWKRGIADVEITILPENPSTRKTFNNVIVQMR